MVWWFNNYLNSYQFLAVTLKDLKRVNSLSVRQHSSETQQGDESGTFQTCMRDISDVQSIVVSCSFSKQISRQYLDYVITASFQLLPHPSLTNHPLVRHYTECSGWGVPNIRMMYESFWAKKNCCTNTSDYRPLHGYKNFNVSRYCTTLYVISSSELTSRWLPPLANTTPS